MAAALKRGSSVTRAARNFGVPREVLSTIVSVGVRIPPEQFFFLFCEKRVVQVSCVALFLFT